MTAVPDPLASSPTPGPPSPARPPVGRTAGHAVYLVRHGESEWNVARLTQGQTMHPALTERGRADGARAGALLRDALAARPEARIWTSDLVRAHETAEIIAELTGAAVSPDKRLREQHLGTLEGRGYEETWAAGEAHDWSDPTLPIAGGESPADVHHRMAEVVQDARRAAESGPVVLVSHGDAIRVAIAGVHGFGPGEGDWVEVPNGAVFEVTGDTVVRLG